MSPSGAPASEAGASSHPQPPPGSLVAVPADGAATTGGTAPRRNRLATAALTCAILGGVLVTIPAGLILGLLGLRQARSTGRGALRCWLAIGVSLAWAGAAAYLVPNVVRAADPGCVAYKNSALASYNRVVSDVNGGTSPAILSRDLAAAIRQIDRAARDSRSATTVRSLHSLSSGLRTVLRDVGAQMVVPRPVLLRLNRETGLADGACGTVRL
jgi:hypothetical protein